MSAGENQEYAQNNYWPSPDQLSIDDIDLDDFWVASNEAKRSERRQ